MTGWDAEDGVGRRQFVLAWKYMKIRIINSDSF